MKLVTVSNYINHHQIPLSDALDQTLKRREDGSSYTFIQTEPMEEERRKMGWEASLKECPYLKFYYKEPELCETLINDADIVIFGGVEDESYIIERLKHNKIVIRSSERLYKEGTWKAISPRGLMKKYNDHTRYARSPVYLLCDGGYVASDFHIVRAYPDKMFRFGYFPRMKEYDITQLLHHKKEKGYLELLWAGRMIDWKHPEMVVKLARTLKEQKVQAHITMIGDGPCREEVLREVKQAELSEQVILKEFMPPEEIRKEMERADIYLFTSDYKEGWGAVLNEAMNSGCAVIASHAPGATPYLIRDGENGLVFKSGNQTEFTELALRLIRDAHLRTSLAEQAYETIKNEWNANEAARRLLVQCDRIAMGQPIDFEASGPMSKAPIIAQHRMYGHLKGDHHTWNS